MQTPITDSQTLGESRLLDDPASDAHLRQVSRSIIKIGELTQLPDHLLLVSPEIHDSGISQIVSRVECIQFCSCDFARPTRSIQWGCQPHSSKEKLTLLLIPDAACFVPRALYKPNEERVKGDRRVLMGIHPRELEFKFASRNIWNGGDETRT